MLKVYRTHTSIKITASQCLQSPYYQFMLDYNLYITTYIKNILTRRIQVYFVFQTETLIWCLCSCSSVHSVFLLELDVYNRISIHCSSILAYVLPSCSFVFKVTSKSCPDKTVAIAFCAGDQHLNTYPLISTCLGFQSRKGITYTQGAVGWSTHLPLKLSS